MMIFWKVRCVNRTTKEFGDRYLYVDTETLDLATKAAIEFLADLGSTRSGRDILRFRSIFREGDWQEVVRKFAPATEARNVGPPEYYEDETGNEVTLAQLGPILTGNPNSRLLPHGAKQHDINLMMAEPKPLPLESVTLSDDEIKLLGYFVRDIQELSKSAFRKNGPGRLSSTGTIPSVANDPVLETSVTDEEIRSFMTIFRRLYMESEPANLCKAAAVYCRALGDHPYAKWVTGLVAEYNSHLATPPEIVPFVNKGQLTFATKRLIDVYLYTQYAHQPDERRERQFNECLQELGGRRGFLTWLFLSEVWGCALEICNVGRVIAAWYRKYCERNPHSVDVLQSLHDEHAGIGSLEKEADRRQRIFDEKVKEFAIELWRQHGCPESGPDSFTEAARDALKKVLDEGPE
jgi:hypothetical protein